MIDWILWRGPALAFFGFRVACILVGLVAGMLLMPVLR